MMVLLTSLIAAHGYDLQFLKSRFNENTAMARSIEKRQKGSGRVSAYDTCLYSRCIEGRR